jgi:phosphatidylglycerol---prolipoprotein diacylglyceryl transferase
MLAIAFPAIDPVAIEIGPFAIRWYALAYIVGLLFAWWYARRLVARGPSPLRPEDMDDLLLYATLGVVLGGRLGYVLFYQPGYFLARPWEVFAVWEGGMSFHGGALGVILGAALFALRRGVPPLHVGDIASAVTPFGLFLGRIANFINGELYGRVADVPWAVTFPRGGGVPRHPSQLYEAALEGLVLFVVLLVLAIRYRGLARPGLLSGAFLAGYGLARIVAELFREPDAHLGFLLGGVTMGQILSLPMIVAGLLLLRHALRAPPLGSRAEIGS